MMHKRYKDGKEVEGGEDRTERKKEEGKEGKKRWREAKDEG